MDWEAPEGEAGPGSPRPPSANEWLGVQARRQDGASAAAAFVSAARSPTLSCAPTVFWARRTLFRRTRMGKRDEATRESGVPLRPLRAFRWQRVRVGEELRCTFHPVAAEPLDL